jgi:tol-pal system protein YbgF
MVYCLIRIIFNRIHNRAILSFGLGAVLLWAACGVAQAGLLDDQEARKQIAAERERLDQALERIGKIEDTLKSQALLDLFTQIEALKVEVSNLRGQIEVLNNSVDGSAKRQRDMYTDLDNRLRHFEQAPPGVISSSSPALPPATPVSAAANSKSAAKVATAPAAAASEDAAYEAAQAQRRSGNYPAAITGFQAFINQYPKSGLAPRAQYWIGDSYFNQRDFKQAIDNQQALIKNYPDSPSVPDAMLNIASSQLELGDSVAGKKTLEDVVTRYPVSDAAEKAKRRLDTLNVAAPATAGEGDTQPARP